MLEELWKAAAVTVVSRSCDPRGYAGRQVSRGPDCCQRHKYRSLSTGPGILGEGGSVPVVRGLAQGEPPPLPVLLGPLTILTLTYEREQSAFLCFYIKVSKQNVSNNTNVFPYSLGHQKLKGYC